MKKIVTLLFLICFTRVLYAAEFTATDAINLLNGSRQDAGFTDADDYNWQTDSRTKIEISNINYITLTNGEDAYLASVYYPNAPRNFVSGYLLARPLLKKAILLDDFGGQYNDIVRVGNYDGGSVLIIGKSASGQGAVTGTYSIVKFDGWSTNVLHAVEFFSSDCGYEFIQGRTCETKEVFLNPIMSEGARVLETIVKTTSRELDSESVSTFSSRLLSFPTKR